MYIKLPIFFMFVRSIAIKTLTVVDGLYCNVDRMGQWTSIATGMITETDLDNSLENSGLGLII